jgi:hypothetical protein
VRLRDDALRQAVRVRTSRRWPTRWFSRCTSGSTPRWARLRSGAQIERRAPSDRAHFVTFRDVVEALVESVRASDRPDDRVARFVRAVDEHDFARGAEGDESISQLFASVFNVSTHLHPVCTVGRMAQQPDPILSLPFFAELQQFVAVNVTT